MVMRYFRAPKFASKKAAGKKYLPEDNLREALLEPPPPPPATSFPGGGVPKGYFTVYVGEEARRFAVPTSCLREPAFRELMERAAEEFGFGQAGGLRVPCAEEDFQELIRILQDKNNTMGKKIIRLYIS